MTQNQSNAPKESTFTGPHYDFPPFPPVPTGVEIIPFKDFKERGIAIFSADDGEEVDGLGNPTIELNAKHENDECKTDAAKYRKRKERAKALKQALNSGELGRRDFWDQWADAEQVRWIAGKSSFVNPLDRFHQAGKDFKSSRTWPPATYGLAQLWDQFRLFAGLLASTPVWTVKGEEQDEGDSNDEDDGDSDFENDTARSKAKNDEQNEAASSEQKIHRKRGRARAPYQGYGEDPISVSGDDDLHELLSAEDLKKEDLAMLFLEDPGTRTTEFLSSYMRKQGLIWAERNLVIIPHLISYFVNYLYHTKVLTDTAGLRSLERGIEVSKLAIEQLPLTAKISKATPDAFSRGCTECFGSRAEVADQWVSSDEPSLPSTPPSEGERLPSSAVVTEINDDDNQEAPVTSADVENEELKANNDVSATSLEDGDALSEEPWDQDMDDINKEAMKSVENEWLEGGTSDWEMPPPPSLMPLLGPSALPVTHSPGIVELSVRRIKSISVPSAIAKSAVEMTSGPSPEAVEENLSIRFAKVVLEPWLDWDTGDEKDQARPKVLNTSVGPIADDNASEAGNNKGNGSKPHNPVADSITALFEPSVVEHFRVGMGIGATWVQLARQFESVPLKTAKKPKGKSKRPTELLWYLDSVSMVFPSFYIPESHNH